MKLDLLTAISPIDGRYRGKTDVLAAYFSEFALIKYRVQVDGKELDLNRKEYDILVYFMNRPGRLVNKNTMAESVWGDHIDQVDNFDFIYAQIKNLRKRLKEAGATPELKAVYGFGYKMVVE